MIRLFATVLLLASYSLCFAQSPAEDLAFINQMLKQYNSKDDHYELMTEGNMILLKYGRKEYESFRMPMANAISYIGPHSTGGGGTNTVFLACKDGSSCMNNGFGQSIPLWFKDVSKGVPNMPEVAKRTNRWLLSLQKNNTKAQLLCSQNDNDAIGQYLVNDMVLTAKNVFHKEANLIDDMVAKLEGFSKNPNGEKQNYYPQVDEMKTELKAMSLRLYGYMGGIGNMAVEVCRLYGQEPHQQFFNAFYNLVDKVRFKVVDKAIPSFEWRVGGNKKVKVTPENCENLGSLLKPYANELRTLANRKAPEIPTITASPSQTSPTQKAVAESKRLAVRINENVDKGYASMAIIEQAVANRTEAASRSAIRAVRASIYSIMEDAAIMGGQLRRLAKVEAGNPAMAAKIKEILVITDKVLVDGKELAAMLPEDEKTLDTKSLMEIKKIVERIRWKYDSLAENAKKL